MNLAPAAIPWGAPGGSAAAKPVPAGPLSCLPNDNSAIWSSELSLDLVGGPGGASCVGGLPKGEDPNSRLGTELPRIPMGVEK